MLTLSTFHTDCDKGSLVCGVFGPAGSYLPRKLLNPGLKLILPTWLLQGSKITFSFYPCKIKIFHVCIALQKVLEKGGKCRKDGSIIYYALCCNLIIAKKATFAQYFLDGEECGRMREWCLVVRKHN